MIFCHISEGYKFLQNFQEGIATPCPLVVWLASGKLWKEPLEASCWPCSRMSFGDIALKAFWEVRLAENKGMSLVQL